MYNEWLEGPLEDFILFMFEKKRIPGKVFFRMFYKHSNTMAHYFSYCLMDISYIRTLNETYNIYRGYPISFITII
jgi:hypothetical protein